MVLGKPTEAGSPEAVEALEGCPASEGFNGEGTAPILFSNVNLPGSKVEVTLDGYDKIDGKALGDLSMVQNGQFARSISLENPAEVSGCLENVEPICANFVQKADGTTEIHTCIEPEAPNFGGGTSTATFSSGAGSSSSFSGFNNSGLTTAESSNPNGGASINFGDSSTGDTIFGDTFITNDSDIFITNEDNSITNVFCGVNGTNINTGDICPDNTTTIITNPIAPEIAPVPLGESGAFLATGLALGAAALAARRKFSV